MKLYKHSERGWEDNNQYYLFGHSPGSKSSLLGLENEMIQYLHIHCKTKFF